NRIGRILGDQYRPEMMPAMIRPELFKDPSEKALFDACAALDRNQPYPSLIEALAHLSPLVETFFDQVLINDPDASIKENRYNLLSLLNRLYLALARFSRLVL